MQTPQDHQTLQKAQEKRTAEIPANLPLPYRGAAPCEFLIKNEEIRTFGPPRASESANRAENATKTQSECVTDPFGKGGEVCRCFVPSKTCVFRTDTPLQNLSYLMAIQTSMSLLLFMTSTRQAMLGKILSPLIASEHRNDGLSQDFPAAPCRPQVATRHQR